jgi:hypothetical protein
MNAVKKADKNLHDNPVYHESDNLAKLDILKASGKIEDQGAPFSSPNFSPRHHCRNPRNHRRDTAIILVEIFIISDLTYSTAVIQWKILGGGRHTSQAGSR